jgi:hemin uptake protein HemP
MTRSPDCFCVALFFVGVSPMMDRDRDAAEQATTSIPAGPTRAARQAIEQTTRPAVPSVPLPTPTTISTSTPTIDFETLSGGQPEVWIVWGGQTYRLRRTRSGKLLLTK